MQITPAPPPGPRDLGIISGTLDTRLQIHPRYRVRTGTPLVIQDNAWRPAKTGERALFFAAEPADGGATCAAFKAAIVETYVRNLKIGPVRISNVDDIGAITFENAPDGAYLAITPSRVLLG